MHVMSLQKQLVLQLLFDCLCLHIEMTMLDTLAGEEEQQESLGVTKDPGYTCSSAGPSCNCRAQLHHVPHARSNHLFQKIFIKLFKVSVMLFRSEHQYFAISK